MNKDMEILIVEDSSTQAEQLRYLLESYNYDVKIAVNGAEALDKIRESKPTLVISDIMMPKLNGLELCSIIKSDKVLKNIPFILLTSLSDPEDILKGLECGADNFIIKPYDEDSLISGIKNLLANFDSREKVESSAIEVYFNNKYYTINSDRRQILDLFMSTFENAVRQNKELIKSQMELSILNEQLEERVENRTAKLIDEIYERKKVEEELRNYQNKLEMMVEERAAELMETNKMLTQEIEERKKIEKEQKLLASIIESSPDFIGMADKNKKTIYLNKSARKTLNIEDDADISDYNFTDYNAETDAKMIDEQGLPYAEQHGYWQGQTEIIDSDGRKIPVSQVITVHRDNNNDIDFYSTIIRDITKLKQVENDLAKKTEDFSRVNEELKQFAYIASHDLQEPLRMVSSYTKLLAKRYKDKLDEDANDYINFAVDGAVRMQKLIDALLYYSRIGTLIKKFKKVDLNEIIDNVRFNLQLLIEETKAEINVENLPELPTDSVQMTQLFQNLISNGLKYIHDKTPVINISAKKLNNEWLFAVQDNGIGIDKENYDRIFIVFQRLHGKNEFSGTGMGLAICKKIIEYHGGHIWVESKPNEGSIFYFTLPETQREMEEN